MATLYIPVASPWGGKLDLVPSVGLTAAILGILVAAAIIIRLTHVFVRGIVRALLNRENVEGTAHELTPPRSRSARTQSRLWLSTSSASSSS